MTHFNIGTTNSNKVKEIISLLVASGCSFSVVNGSNPEEVSDTFEGNAIIKAKAYAKESNGITISEDSGLVVPVIGGLPGHHSSRFFAAAIKNNTVVGIDEEFESAHAGNRDELNNRRLLEMMKGIPQPNRGAYFISVIVVASPEDILFSCQGLSYGWIAESSAGSNGFGYDPVFIGEDTFGATYAELDSFRKNLRSHRRKALIAFKEWLGKFVSERQEQ